MEHLDQEAIFRRLIKQPVPRLCKLFFDSIPDDQLRSLVVTHIAGKRKRSEPEPAFLARLAPEARMFLLVDELDSEVRKGGFNQYFFNSKGAFIDEAISAVDTICGAPFSKPLASAARHYRHQDHIHLEARQSAQSPEELLSGFLDSYGSIDFWEEDTQWYTLSDEVNRLMIRFLKKNSEAFLDTHEELVISDWLNEPKKYRSDQQAHKLSLDALKNWKDDDPETSRTRLLNDLLTAARQRISIDQFDVAETIIREALGWLEMELCDNEQIQFTEPAKSLLECYAEILEKMERTVQAQAVRREMARRT